MGYYASSRSVTPIVISELGRDIALWNDLRALWKLYRLFCRERPDIIHTHTAKAGAVGRVAGLLYNLGRALSRRDGRAKLVHSFHGHIFQGYFSHWKSRVLILIERALALITNRIVAVSESIERDLVEVYKICPRKKITVIPIGLDFSWVSEVPRWRGVLRGEFLVSPDQVTIGIIGRLTEIKNHPLFLSAVRIVCKRQNIQAFIIGDGELQGEIARAVYESGLSGRVALTGWQREPEKIYADLDIVCLTSLNEGTPVVLGEAMAAGVAFVATDVGGVRDLVVGSGEIHPSGFEIFANGILVPPNDPEALAAALTLLVENPTLRLEMGKAGRRLTHERYSQDRLLQDIKHLYTNLLSPVSNTPKTARGRDGREAVFPSPTP
jgi:glycosyltransferase involved in cell wall biosynthesis